MLRTFRLLDEANLQVAMVEGKDDDALRDIQHYALVYGQDGPVKIQELVNGHWRTFRTGDDDE